ncbi:cyd operon protein YbgE [[Haemophilus] felis]|uniref:Cyd operon protein YbgE n=1 Tax=[Haemophilus] felis TaxID=123822 RepID=A0A1T0BC78_9PAST|nr:cyd operon protein YbgE [[Haemophilus] felis]NBI39988.1 cyd operon protein YbgE [[Haemophilus] felis]NBI41918.1 cyd operon protein YbgE [[Haemophilus] felis]OOS07596.1 cyd operon protein YbgE [[Haemophilus] felis]
MINSAYQLFNKGSFRTLSFLLAIVITICFFFNINQFSTNLRSAHPSAILFIIWSLGIGWSHGIGFEIRNAFFKLIFMPVLGYVGMFLAIYLSWLS